MLLCYAMLCYAMEDEFLHAKKCFNFIPVYNYIVNGGALYMGSTLGMAGIGKMKPSSIHKKTI